MERKALGVVDLIPEVHPFVGKSGYMYLGLRDVLVYLGKPLAHRQQDINAYIRPIFDAPCICPFVLVARSGFYISMTHDIARILVSHFPGRSFCLPF